MMLGVLAVLGVLGGTIAATRVPTHAATASVLLASAPVYLAHCPATSRMTSPSTRKRPWSTPSDAVQQVLTDLGLEDASALRDSVSVTAPSNWRVLDITVRGSDANEAVGSPTVCRPPISQCGPSTSSRARTGASAAQPGAGDLHRER